MSERGESRSCGRVSQDGNSAIVSGGSRVRSAAAEVLGLPAGRGDGEHGPVGLAGQRGHGEGAGGGRADEVDTHPVAVGRGLHRFGECRVTYDDIQQTVQAHEGLPSG